MVRRNTTQSAPLELFGTLPERARTHRKANAFLPEQTLSMREEGSNEKDGVDEIQWKWTRRMECMNLVKRWRSGDNTHRIKRQEEMHKQRKEIGMSKRASKRLVLPAPEFTAERVGRRPMIGSKRRRERRAGRPLAMVRESGLARPRLAQSISMNARVDRAEAERIEDKERRDSPLDKLLSSSSSPRRSDHTGTSRLLRSKAYARRCTRVGALT